MLLLETLLRGLGDLESSDPYVFLACKLQREVGSSQEQHRLHDQASLDGIMNGVIYNPPTALCTERRSYNTR
jgi:hypothetical protein